MSDHPASRALNRPLAGAGCFGKVPTLGDFLTRRLPRGFVDPWDAWLRQALARSRQQLGDDWLNAYLTSPVWRFALSPSLCDAAPWAGVLIPSVDRIGRYYPLVVTAPAAAQPIALFRGQGAWYDAAEALALSALANDFDADGFERDLAALPELAPSPPSGSATNAAAPDAPLAWQLPLAAPEDFAGVAPTLLETILGDVLDGYSLWWTLQGSDRVAPCLLLARGLPPVDGYVALLQGDWGAGNWRSIPSTETIYRARR